MWGACGFAAAPKSARSWSPSLAPSKIFSEVSGNAGVESKARNWVESIARFGERANDSCPRERSTLRARV